MQASAASRVCVRTMSRAYRIGADPNAAAPRRALQTRPSRIPGRLPTGSTSKAWTRGTKSTPGAAPWRRATASRPVPSSPPLRPTGRRTTASCTTTTSCRKTSSAISSTRTWTSLGGRSGTAAQYQSGGRFW